MTMHFLCELHRDQLRACPEQACHFWEHWLERGRLALKEGDRQTALKFLGCSFELSELLLEQPAAGHNCGSWRPADRFMVSGHFLAEGFARFDRVGLERHCLMAVHYRLLKEMRRRPSEALALKTNLEISLLMLERHFTAHDEFSLLTKCYNEGMLTLQSVAH